MKSVVRTYISFHQFKQFRKRYSWLFEIEIFNWFEEANLNEKQNKGKGCFFFLFLCKNVVQSVYFNVENSSTSELNNWTNIWFVITKNCQSKLTIFTSYKSCIWSFLSISMKLLNCQKCLWWALQQYPVLQSGSKNHRTDESQLKMMLVLSGRWLQLLTLMWTESITSHFRIDDWLFDKWHLQNIECTALLRNSSRTLDTRRTGKSHCNLSGTFGSGENFNNNNRITGCTITTWRQKFYPHVF